MDGSPTAAFTLGPPVPGARAAVLVLHGFTGSPWEVRPLAEALAARGYHVHAPRLPGHGGAPEAMQYVTWRDWEAAADEALLKLQGAAHCFVAGLSMGALLALLLAARHPTKVKALALLAPVWAFRPLDARLLRALRFLPLPEWTGAWISKSASDIEDPLAHADNPLLPRYPLGRLFDLFRVQDHARAALPEVTAPALVMASPNDHVVSPKGVEALAAALHTTPRWLGQGFHVVTRDLDRAVVSTEVARFFDSQCEPQTRKRSAS